LARIRVIFDYIVDILFYLGCAFIAFAFVTVATEVIMRLFLDLSIFWATSITEYSLVTSVCFGAAWVLKKEGHVILDPVINLFKPRWRAIADTITSTLGAILCGLICWYGVVTVLFHIEKGTVMVERSLELHTALLVVVVPIGFFLLFFQFLRRAYGSWHHWKIKSAEEGEPSKKYEDVI